jgi:hypothetical protein
VADIASGDGAYDIENGYELTKVIGGLSYPSNVEFGGSGELYFTESGFTYPFIYKKSRIYRLLDNGKKEVVAEGFHGPLIGLKWHQNGFLATHRGTLSRVELDGTRTDLVTDIPAVGDHHTNHIVVRDDKVYFGQGTVTNSGIVGKDNAVIFGWLVKHHHGHDTPGHDVVLSGKSYKSLNPLKPIETVETGPYLPLGTPARRGQVVRGQLKSNGVVYRCNPDGTALEVYAWGLRNPYGLALDRDSGRIFVLDQGADARGSRPVETPDVLYELKDGAWYGWPDFFAGKPITEYDPDAQFVLQQHPAHEVPVHTFTAHSSSVTLDFSTSDSFGFKGQAFVAQYGTEAPFTTGGKPLTAGRAVVRVELGSMTEQPFFQSKTVAGLGKGPNRPVAAKFSPDGEALFIMDHGVRTIPKSGGIWKITRK